MSQITERTEHRAARPEPDEAELCGNDRPDRGGAALLRVSGALAVLVVGAVHLEQYFGAHFDAVHVIGPLFLLNFVGATVIGAGLMIPWQRLRPLRTLLALGGIGLSITSLVFLFISEQQPLFGFQEHGYRTAIVVAVAAEAAAVVLLGAYLVGERRR